MSTTVLRAIGLCKVYAPLEGSATGLDIFRGLDLEVAAAEMVAIVGESGAGKSSLLHLLAALDKPTSGEVWCGDTCVTRLTTKQAATYRNREVGYVWQFHYLLPEFTAEENVAMPLLARGVARAEALQTAVQWLNRVGLSGRGRHRAGELSGGEQQRVSIARALAASPKVILADEPTGDLDDITAERVFMMLRQLCSELDLASVIVTHNVGFARRCDRVLRLRGGALVTEPA